ncbi:Ig-like domain-containing protein [Bacterioplanoides sp.]|uniref:Ig-like domain-containing protein n=1 Tax=Bacterioplanoides sp. TaxID=2066072 RepID=UPI003B599336
MKALSSLSMLATVALLTGCISEDEKKKIEQAGVDLNKLANQIIVTAPAAGATVNTAEVIVRADIPSDVKAKSVTLLVDGVEVGKDDDGAPWEIKWPAYYWGDGNKHSLLLKTVSGSGVELRNEPTSVTVSHSVNTALKLTSDSSTESYTFGKSTTLTFTPVDNAKHYEFDVAGDIIQSDEPEVTLDSLSVGLHEIKYRAVLDNASQQTFTGPYSTATNVQVQAPYSADQLAITPAKGSLAIKDSNSIELNLAAVAGAKSYEVVSGSKNHVVTEPKVTVDQLAIGSHEVKYRAKFEDDKAGAFTGAFSAPVTVVVEKPGFPVNIKVSANLVDKEYQLDFSWDAMANTQEYEVILEGLDKREKPYTTKENKLIIPKVALGTYKWTIRRKNTVNQWSDRSDKKDVNVGVFKALLGGAGIEYGKEIVTASDGGAIVLANTRSRGDAQGDDWIIKLDSSGAVEWEYVLRKEGTPRLNYIKQLSDGAIYAVGDSGSWRNSKGYAVKLFSDENINERLAWETEYRTNVSGGERFKGIAEKNNKLYIASEEYSCFEVGSRVECQVNKMTILELATQDGKYVSNITVPELNAGSAYTRIGHFTLAKDGDFLLACSAEPSPKPASYFGDGACLVKFDVTGQKAWEQTMLNDGMLNGRFVYEMPDGSFVLSGQNVFSIDGGIKFAIIKDGSAVSVHTRGNGGYSNARERMVSNGRGGANFLITNRDSDLPELWELSSDGNTKMLKTFERYRQSKLHLRSFALNQENGLYMLFSMIHPDSQNRDLVIMKTDIDGGI